MKKLLFALVFLLPVLLQAAVPSYSTTTRIINPTNLVYYGSNFIDRSDVRWYGAAGDGVTDDTAAINLAITNANGRAILVPQGNYRISGPIILLDNTVLHGYGPSSKITLLNGANCAVLQNADWTNGNTNITIQGLWLDGNRANQVGVVGDGPGQSCISLVNVKQALVSDCRLSNPFLHGLELSTPDIATNSAGASCQDVVVEGCLAENFGDDGFTTHFCKRVSFIGCVSKDAAASYSASSNGIEIDDGSADVSITGCLATRCISGFQTQGHGDRVAATRISWVNCVATSNTQAGFKVLAVAPLVGNPQSVSILGGSAQGNDVGIYVSNYSDVSAMGVNLAGNTNATQFLTGTNINVFECPGYNSLVTVTAAKKMGVGNMNPGRDISVHNPNSASTAVQVCNSQSGSNNIDGAMMQLASDTFNLWNFEGRIVFAAQNIERARIDGASFGVLTNSAKANFHVHGTSYFQSIVTNAGGTVTGPSGALITNILTGSAALTFAAVAAQTSQDQPITVTGTTTNDVVTLGVPFHVAGSGNINSCFTAFTSNDTVWVRYNNYSAVTRATNGVFKALVTKF